MLQIDNWSSQLLDSVSIGICILSREYKVVYWNDYMQSYTGISQEQMLGQFIGLFFPSFKRDQYKERIEQVFEGWPPVFFSSRLNTLFQSEAELQKLQQTYQDVTVSALFDKEELNYYAVISVEDVTDLNKKLEERNVLYKKAQQEIEIREKIQTKLIDSEIKLLDLNKTKDKLFSIISHDLRSPLSAILGYLDLLHKSYDLYSDVHKKSMIEMVNEGARQTFNLLENLLNWAKTQLDETSINPEVFDLRKLIDDGLSLAKYIAVEKQLELISNVAEEILVKADRQMIQTVFRNLLSNAMKFTHRGGFISIHSTIETNMVWVSVADTGVGMDEKALKHIFTIDYHKSTKGTANEQGSGLGLILCKELVSLNLGEIKVRSVKGKGTTFTFSMPLADSTLS
jgi:PAS domain S-box-containing protein